VFAIAWRDEDLYIKEICTLALRFLYHYQSTMRTRVQHTILFRRNLRSAAGK